MPFNNGQYVTSIDGDSIFIKGISEPESKKRPAIFVWISKLESFVENFPEKFQRRKKDLEEVLPFAWLALTQTEHRVLKWSIATLWDSMQKPPLHDIEEFSHAMGDQSDWFLSFSNKKNKNPILVDLSRGDKKYFVILDESKSASFSTYEKEKKFEKNENVLSINSECSGVVRFGTITEVILHPFHASKAVSNFNSEVNLFERYKDHPELLVEIAKAFFNTDPSSYDFSRLPVWLQKAIKESDIIG